MILRARIPFDFVEPRAGASWTTLRHGLENLWLDPDAAIVAARRRLADPTFFDETISELSRADSVDRIVCLVDELAGREPEVAVDVLRRSWLFLVLAWLWEHRAEEEDPLRMVELVYAEFGYPREVASFVRYMPMEGDDLGSRERNEQRLFDRWRQFVESEGRALGPR